MTVSSQIREAKSLCNGVTTVFPVPFQYIDSGDLVVSLIDATTAAETDLSEGTDYTLSGTPTAGDVAITALVAFPAGKILWRRRVTAKTQEQPYTPNDGFPAKSHEAALDKLTLIAQEEAATREALAERALLLPDGEMASIIPPPRLNVGKLLSAGALGVLMWVNAGGADAALREDLAQIGAALIAYSQDTAGAVPQSLATRLRRVVYLDDFGGSPDYVPATGTWTTDNAAAAIKACAKLGPRGGRVKLRGDYYFGGFTVPPNVVFEGEGHVLGDSIPANMLNRGTKIWHSADTDLLLDTSSGLRRVSVWRTGLQFNISSAQMLASFAGYGIKSKAGSTDQFVEDMTIFGFAWGHVPETITTDLSVVYARFNFKGRVAIDCLNGARFHNLADISRINAPHFFPYVTVLSTPETNGAQLKRPGWALLLTGLNDHTMVFQAFNYGYLNGFHVIDGADTTWLNCDADYPYQSVADGSFGFQSSGSAVETRWLGCQAIQRDTGFLTDPTISSSTGVLIHSQAIGCDAWENRVNTHAFTTGRGKIVGGSSRSSVVGANGIQTANAPSIDVAYSMHHFANLSRATVNGSPLIPLRDAGGNTYANIQQAEPHQNRYLPQIAVAATVMPNGSDRRYQLTGAGNVSSIGLPASLAGEVLLFKVVAGCTFVTGGNLFLKTGANTAVAAGQIISFFSDGANWIQA